MDFQFWLYLIIGVIYFLSRVLKKQEPEQPAAPQQPMQRPRRQESASSGQHPVETARPLTFEELLKELTEAKQPQKPVYQSPPERKRVDYDDEIGEEEQSLEKVEEDDYRNRNKRYEEYEEATKLAFERPSLEETMNIRDTVVQFGKFKEFEQSQQKDLLAEYTKNFKDPDGLKKAIVMGEILNRRFQY